MIGGGKELKGTDRQIRKAPLIMFDWYCQGKRHAKTLHYADIHAAAITTALLGCKGHLEASASSSRHTAQWQQLFVALNQTAHQKTPQWSQHTDSPTASRLLSCNTTCPATPTMTKSTRPANLTQLNSHIRYPATADSTHQRQTRQMTCHVRSHPNPRRKTREISTRLVPSKSWGRRCKVHFSFRANRRSVNGAGSSAFQLLNSAHACVCIRS
jgi:hypothetical protein